MSKKFIPASVLFDEWRKDPQYVKAYDVLDDEFARAQTVIGRKIDDLKRSN
jgi:hypothetical protein